MTTRNVKTQKLASYCSSHDMSTRLGGAIKDKNVPVQSVNEQINKYKEKPTKFKCRNSSPDNANPEKPPKDTSNVPKKKPKYIHMKYPQQKYSAQYSQQRDQGKSDQVT